MPRSKASLAHTSSTGPLTFGAWLQQRRTFMGMLRKELAEHTHFSLSTIKGYELNLRRPSIGAIKTLAEVLHLATDLLPALIAFSRGFPPSLELLTLVQSNVLLSSTRLTSTLALDEVPFVVPSPVTGLLGRSDELTQAMSLMRQPSVRLVSVLGPPGVGKTRFSLALAPGLREQFDGGIFFVALAPITQSEDAVLALCDVILPSFGMRRGDELDALTRIKQVIADKNILLILDNFEHLLSDATVHLVSNLLAATTHLKIITTTREPLQIYGEYRLTLPPLNFPSMMALAQPHHFAQMHHYPAIALFVERAQAAQSKFELDETNATHVAQLCAMLDGLPLAIEIVASHVAYEPIPRLVHQLQDHPLTFNNLTRDTPLRHRSLHNAIAYSYNRLNALTQRVLCGLSVFAGSFDFETARAVIRITVEELQQLIRHNLVQTFVEGGERRYSLLKTVRDFAHDRLDQLGLRQQTYAHLSLYCCDVLDQYGLNPQAQHGMAGPASGAAKWIRQNLDTIRSAIAWSQSEDGDLEIMMALTKSAIRWWHDHGYMREAQPWLIKSARIAHRQDTLPSDAFKQAVVQLAINLIYSNPATIHDPDLDAMLQRAVEFARSHGDVNSEGHLLESWLPLLIDAESPTIVTPRAMQATTQQIDAIKIRLEALAQVTQDEVARQCWLTVLACAVPTAQVDHQRIEQTATTYLDMSRAHCAWTNVVHALLVLMGLAYEQEKPEPLSVYLAQLLAIPGIEEDRFVISLAAIAAAFLAARSGQWERCVVIASTAEVIRQEFALPWQRGVQLLNEHLLDQARLNLAASHFEALRRCGKDTDTRLLLDTITDAHEYQCLERP